MQREIEKIGLVGCGRMGSAMGRHLLARGWTLGVTDVDAGACAPLVEAGATDLPTARDVATASDLVLVVVVDDDQVREAVEGSGGALKGMSPGSVIAICASVRPDTCRELAATASAAGVHLIDVALVRGERGAETGELLLLCGGDPIVIDTCRPAFSAFASGVKHLGGVGAGQAGKAVNNVLLWACIRADVEALRLGRALGVEPAVLRGALAVDGSGANRPLAEWGEHRLRWPAKDLEVALALAEEISVDMPFIAALPALMDDLSVDDLRELL